MMKKVLSVALSVIMVLSLIAVPGFAADPAAAVEYTVSNVSYAGQVYDELNPDADGDGYVLAEGIQTVPDNGKKLVPSVEVSATAETTATVIFAVYTDGVLSNAFYETKAVGATAQTFSKEITVANKDKETYKVFVLDANGNSIAPTSSFPVAENALEYMVITYADGTSEKIFASDVTNNTVIATVSAERKVANPSFKVVPADNSTVVDIAIASNFWNDGATITLKALDGTIVTYSVVSDMIKMTFTPVLGDMYRFGGTEFKKTPIEVEKMSASFEAAQTSVDVVVPYGTKTVNVDAFTIYEGNKKYNIAAETVDMGGTDSKKHTVYAGTKAYEFNYKWDASAPYVSDVVFNSAYPKRTIVLRADGASTIGHTQDSGDIKDSTTAATTSKAIVNAGAANTELTVNGTAIPNNSNFTVFAIGREDNYVRSDMINYTQPKWAHVTENPAWATFKVSSAATVYVKMSHANAAEADFVWKEGVAAGWTKAASSNQGIIYYKTFAAGETVNVPSQVVTEEEIAFVNAKLAAAYPETATEVGSVQFMYQLADVGAQLYYKELTDAGWSAWTAHPLAKNDGATAVTLLGKSHRGLYYRNSADHKLSIGAYGSNLFIAVAFDNAPAGGEDPDQPGEGGGDEPVVPPTPATPKLSWTSALALTGEPKTQDAAAANTNLYAKGLYGLGNQSGEIELNPEETTVNLTVPYGVEAIVLNGGAKIDLLGDADHAVTTTVTVNEVEYTVNVAWAAYAYAEGLPMLYDLQYHVAGKENLAGGETWYYAVPSNLVLNADMDVVYGEGDLKGSFVKNNGATYTTNKLSGTWFTSASQKKGNYSTVNGGANINRLRIAPSCFRTFVDAGLIDDLYAFNGATIVVTHYKDAVNGTVVSPRFTFKSGVKGYVIAAYNKAQTLGDEWTKIDGVKVETTNASTGDDSTALANPPEGHTNAVTNFGVWFNGYDHVFVKPVNVGDTVTINETAVTADQPPYVMVVTEDMIDLDIEIPDAPGGEDPEQPGEGGDPVDPNPGEGEDPTPDVPAAAKLASLTYATEAHLRYTEAATETGTEAWAEDATEYVVKVPIGTGTVTVSAAADYAETPNALDAAVVVDMAGKDEATAEILGNTVKFVWDNTDPYITDVVMNAAYNGRWGVDSGADGDLTYTTTGTNNSGALGTASLTGVSTTGVSAPAATKYVYSIASHSMNGHAHMAAVLFPMRDTVFAGTTAENSLLSFKVSAPATVYVKAVAINGVWEELAAAGWTVAGTMIDANTTLYKKDFAAGEYVYLPGTPGDEAEAEWWNATSDTMKYVKYVADETVETTTGAKTQKEAFEAAGLVKSSYKADMYFQWSYDAESGKLVAPLGDNSNKAKTFDRGSLTKYSPIFYVQFEEPAAPVVPTLASYSVTTTKSAIHQDVVAVTDEAGTFEGEEYTIVVPVGTASATAVLTDSTGATATAEVDFAGLDAAEATVTIGENTYTVEFVWDDTNPYFYNVKFNESSISVAANRYGTARHVIQYGNLAETLKVGADKNHVPAGSAVSTYEYVGVPTPDATADTVVIGIPSAVGGQAHMQKATFPMINLAFPATDASNAYMTFRVGATGTVYVKSPANAGVWPEMDALVADENSGWYRVTYTNGEVTKNATIGGMAVYAIDVEKGDTVMIPSMQHTDAYMEAYNASLATRGEKTRVLKYTATDAVVTTTTGDMTWAAAFEAAGITDLGNAKVDTWYIWNWDNEANLPKLPVKYPSKSSQSMPTNSQLFVYGYFGDYEYVPETPVDPDPTPDQPTPDEPTPDTPVVPDNSANELVLSYTTALAVTSPKETDNHINGKNRVDGKASIYAGGLYMPTLVETAANAVVDHEAKTAVVTVPFGTEIVNLVAATGAEVAIDLADNASIVMLNDNGAEKTFDVVAGENTYAVTVKWADASDANIGAASTGADVYGLQFAKADLWTAGQDAVYGIVPTKIDLSYEVSVDASKYEEGQVPTSLRNGVYYAGGNTTLFAGNMTSKNNKTGGYSALARYKLFTGSFTPWVEAGIIASEADLDNATIVNTGEHYKDAEYETTSSNAPADGARYAFNVEAAGVVYVASAKTFSNDGTWTKVDAETLMVTRGGSSGTGYIYSIGTLGSTLYVKNVAAGEKVTITCAGKTDQPPVVIYDAGAVFAPADPTFASASYKIGDADDTAIDFAAGTTAAVEVPWGTDADISVAATINGIGSVAVSDAINLATAVDNTADVTITVKAFDGEVVATYTVTFAWGEKPADPEEPGEGGDPVDPNPGEGEEPTPEEPTPVSLDDIEDMGILADTAEDFNASQSASSADVTVEGNGAARGETVIAMVLAPGKTLADLLAVLSTSGTGDLMASGIILAIGSDVAEADGSYEVDMKLPATATSGDYDITILTEETVENVEGALEFVAMNEKVAAYNAIVNGEANPFADVDLIIETADIYAALAPANQAAVEASVLAKDAVAALPEIAEPAPGDDYVGLENIATLAAIIDTRIAVEALNDGADAAELALVWNYILPVADANSDDIVAVAAAIYAGDALNAAGKANVVAAIAEQDYETKTVGGAQVSVKTQLQEDFAEAAFVELINNTNYTSVNSVKPLVEKYIEADVFEDMDEVTNTILADILKNKTITSYASFVTLVNSYTKDDNTSTGNTTIIVPGTGSSGSGATSGSMSNTTKPQQPVEDEKEQPKKSLSEFSDAADAAWAAPALQLMLDREILSGYEDGTIKPNNSATRQEVAKMLVEAFSEVNAGAWVGYDDVPSDAWYYSYVATATYEGIIKGVGDNKFGAGALITRQDLSVLIYRYLVNKGNVLNTNSANFTDAANISDYAAEAINALTNAGVIKGYADGSFNPQASATRAEIAQVIANVITIFGL